ncbi:shikimate kinase [Clostridium chauvoei]|uniref:Shikimate kinase n=2 Tax=Clostridium chauvoei TaxID=46867 RepID=A0A1U6J2E4_9CLOT|nr:shikimate kinase [Clostridium chauvoei]ATD54451.1 shikimate kinase [Clostridium chauvoei]ATD57865.1 shikimate kinase [Clostridium chauvoei]MBX7281718.1 shikimate kinase [Clostridium chauvoei]MBX7284221.1 shikimate kinase [Clostridium chauvoei]MBX7286766.1 shikimate kinase [Clostridium chauvoei]
MNKKSILLIGMPGCGKTTIGKILANELNYNFYDMDKYIEKISGQNIKEIFKVSEKNFRDIETKACLELCKKKMAVISSGGGVVKRKKNIDLFKDNSIIIFIDRPLENILKDVNTSTRPLLTEGKEKLYKLYEERYRLYNEYSHLKVINDGFIKDVVLEIKKCIK